MAERSTYLIDVPTLRGIVQCLVVLLSMHLQWTQVHQGQPNVIVLPAQSLHFDVQTPDKKGGALLDVLIHVCAITTTLAMGDIKLHPA